VKYLGGITFLLNDGCPENADQASISQYFQCLQSEKLHVSRTKLIEYQVLTAEEVAIFYHICAEILVQSFYSF
jgi:hypothetical protein